MTTDRQCILQARFHRFLESTLDPRAQEAQEHAAVCCAHLAIARWISSSACEHRPVDASAQIAARAKWYAQAHANLQEWLGRGGFAQTDQAAAGPSPRSETPLADARANSAAPGSATDPCAVWTNLITN
jgi:hypothetical protein